MNYNFVLMGYGNDYYYQAFADILSLDNVFYIPDHVLKMKKNNNLLYRIHMGTINRYISMPYKHLWNKTYFDLPFNNNKPICFVMWGIWANLNLKIGLSDYLRKTYKGCKIVWFLQDLVKFEKDFYYNIPININDYKKLYDLIVSYDVNECKRYGFAYHPTVMSYSEIEEDDSIPKSDALFIARDKGRLQLAIDIYNKLTNAGLKCDFRILGVDKNKQVNCKGIKYLDTLIPYRETLRYIVQTKCIVELLQENAEGCTFRTWEALLYNKYLITNNQSLKTTKYYNKASMSIIKGADDIESWFINKLLIDDKVSYNIRSEISPVSFLFFLEKTLQQ